MTGQAFGSKQCFGIGAALALMLVLCASGTARPVGFAFSADAGLGYHGVFNHGILTLDTLKGSSPLQHGGMFSVGSSLGLMLFGRVAPMFDINWHTGFGDTWVNPPLSHAPFKLVTNSLGLGLRLMLAQGSTRPYVLAGKTMRYNWVSGDGNGFRDGGGEYYLGTGLVWVSGSGWGGGFEVMLRPHTFRSLLLGSNYIPIWAQGTALSIQVVGIGLWTL
jgi:hypothetical protein